MRPVALLVVLLLLPSTTVLARDPTPEEVLQLRLQLSGAYYLLDHSAGSFISGGERKDLRNRIQAADRAIKRFITTTEQGQTRGKLMASYAGAAGVILGDDVTGIGVADDPLLIVIALAAVVTMIASSGPPSSHDLEVNWTSATQVVMGAVGLAQEIQRRRASSAAPGAGPLARASGLSVALPGAIVEAVSNICNASRRAEACERAFSNAAVDCLAIVFSDKAKQRQAISGCVQSATNQLKQCCGWASPSSRN